MVLDNFRTIELIWDKANKSIIKTIKTASSDTTGRYFSVKVLDEGQEVDLTGAKLQLYWEHPNFNTNGTDDFTAVDTKGKFSLTFSKELLTNIGELNANLVLTLTDGKITSDTFKIEVIKGADAGVVVAKGGNSVIDNKIDKGNVRMGDLTQEVKLAMTGGSVAVVGEGAVDTINIKNAAVTNSKLSDYYNSRDRIYSSGNLNDFTKEGLWFKPSGSNPSHTPTEIIGYNVVLSVSVFSHSSLGTFVMQTLNPLGSETIKYARSFKLGDVPPEFKNTTINSIERTLTDAERYICEEPPTELTNQMASIRDIEVIGADPETPLKFWMICRDFSTWNDRIMIARKQNGQWKTYLDSGINFEVQENEVGYTPVEFVSNGVTFRAKIDYSAFPSGGRMIQGSTVDIEPFYIIPQKNVRLTENGTGGGGGTAYDQSLNTDDSVKFASVETDVLELTGTIQTGTLSSPPTGLLQGDMWADTTDSTTHPVVRVKL